jgi:WD40 repeat protein
MPSGREALLLSSGSDRYDLGLTCGGDRTGWCCPYPMGTRVQAIGKVSGAAGSLRKLSDYRLCAEAGPGAPPAGAPGRSTPALVDFGEAPGTVVWTVNDGLAVGPLAGAPTILKQPTPAGFACLSVAPSARAAFSIDAAGQASLWSLPEGKPLAHLAGFAASLRAEAIRPDLSCTYLLSRKLEWSPQSDRLLTVQLDGKVRVWDVGAAGQFRLEPTYASETAHAGYFSPDGAAVLVPTATANLELRRAADGRLLGQVKGGGGYFAPDQKTIVVDDGSAIASSLRLWKPQEGASPRVILNDACGVQPTADGRLLAALSPCESATGVLLELPSGRKLVEHPDTFRPLVSSSRFRPARFRDDLAFLIEKVEPPSRPPDLTTTPAATVLVAFARPDGVELWGGGRALAKLSAKVPAWRASMRRYAQLAFSPDGAKLASPYWLWNRATPKRTASLEAVAPHAQLIFSPNSRFLAQWSWRLTGSGNVMELRLTVYDATSGKQLHRVALEQPAASRQAQVGLGSPVWLPHTALLVVPVLGNDAALDLVDVQRGRQLRVSLTAEATAVTPGGADELTNFLRQGEQ